MKKRYLLFGLFLITSLVISTTLPNILAKEFDVNITATSTGYSRFSSGTYGFAGHGATSQRISDQSSDHYIMWLNLNASTIPISAKINQVTLKTYVDSFEQALSSLRVWTLSDWASTYFATHTAQETYNWVLTNKGAPCAEVSSATGWMTLPNGTCGLTPSLNNWGIAVGTGTYFYYSNLETATSSNVPYFIVNYTIIPNITLIFPANNTIKSFNKQLFSCEDTTDYGFSNITLYLWNSTGTLLTAGLNKSCYQETANASSSLDTSGCSLNYGGNYTWDSDRTIWINYSKPSTALSASWKVKLGDIDTIVNIPSNCFLNTIQLRLYDPGPLGEADCYDGTNWNTLVSTNNQDGQSGLIVPNPVRSFDGNWDTSVAATASGFWTKYDVPSRDFRDFYEEAIIWNTNLSTNITSNSTQAYWNYNFTTDGNYKWNCLSKNNVSESDWADSNFTYIIDTTTPLIQYGNLVENNGANFSRNFIYINTTWTELNFANITFKINNTKSQFYSTATYDYNFTSLGDGTYYYNVTLCDLANNCNITSTRKITLDNTKPSLSITYPQAQNYSINISSLNYTVSDANLFNCWYNLGGANISVTCGNNLTGLTSTEGYNNWTVYANDTASNLQNSTITFFKDTVYPLISFGTLTLTDGENKSQSNIYMNVTVTELNFKNITFNVNNARQTYTTRTYDYNKTGLANGTFYYNVTICDTLNNCNITSTRQITLDTGLPGATLTSPANDSTTQNASLNFTASLTDNLGIKNATLNIYNSSGLYNQTTISYASSTISTTVGIVVNLVDNLYTWFYSVFDWAGNSVNSVNNTVYKDAGNLDFCHPIDSNGTYLLNKDIIATGDCFNIRANNIIFDCNSFSIKGPGGVTSSRGIYTTGYSNITIQNCNITNFGYQISFTNSNNDQLTNIFSKSNTASTFYGINLNGAINTTITNLTIQNVATTNFYGIFQSSSNNTKIYNSTLTSNSGSSNDKEYGSSNNNYNTQIYNSLIDILEESGYNMYIKDSQIQTIAMTHTGATASRNNTLLNTTTNINWGTATTSTVYKKWYVNLNSTDNSGNPIEALFQVYDSIGTILFNGYSTPDQGTIATQIITESLINETSPSLFYVTPHIINASATGYITNTTYMNLTNTHNTNLQIRLQSSDLTAPVITILYPAAINYSSVSSINFTATDSSLQTCWFTNNSGITNTTISCTNNYTRAGIAGLNTWTVYANDSNNNLGSTSITFFVDSTNPGATLVSPAAGTSTNNGTITFNYSVSDNLGLKNSTIHVWNQTAEINSTTTTFGSITSSSVQLVIDLIEGAYNWFVSLFDVVGNSYVTGNNTLTLDFTAPLLNIDYPLNYYNYTSVTSFNYSSNGTRCWNSINGGVSNSSSVSCGTNFTLTASEGLNTWIVYANDSVGNLNSTNVTFIKDSTEPTITITSPIDFHTYAVSNVSFNFTITDSGVGLSNCWYNNDSNPINITTACNNNLTLNSSNDGAHMVKLWANDTLNNLVNKTITYYTSTSNPAINLDYPIDNKYKNSATTIFNFTVTSSQSLDTCELWGNWSGTWTINQTMTGMVSSQTINFSSINLAQGNYIWNVWCNDSVNNFDFHANNHTLTIDLTNPNSTLDSPVNNSKLNYSQVTFNYTISDNRGIQNSTLHIWNQTAETNTQYTPLGGLIQTLSYPISLIDGFYKWFISLFDLAGNFYVSINNTILVDTIYPIINITNLNNGTYNYLTTTLNYTITETNLDSCWVINNSGQTNQINCGNNISMNLFQGSNNFTIYANDSVNHISSNSISLFLDTISPTIIINLPLNATYSIQNIQLNVTPSETITSYQYSLNGDSNITFTNGQTITFDPGNNQLIVYGTDLAGNIGSSTRNFYISFTNLVNINLTKNPVTPQIGSNLSLIANVTTDNTRLQECNFTLTSPTHSLYSNQIGLNSSNNYWVSSYYLLNESGQYNYSVSCKNEFGSSASSNSTFVVSAYNLTILEPLNPFSFAAKVSKTEQKNITFLLFDNVASDINYTIDVQIENETNFTWTYPRSFVLNSDSSSSPKEVIISIQAGADTSVGSYLGKINLTNKVTGIKTVYDFTYGVNPPSAIPRLFDSTGTTQCSGVFGGVCSINVASIIQGATSTYNFHMAKTGNYAKAYNCSLKLSGNLNQPWITYNLSNKDLDENSLANSLSLFLSPTTSTPASSYSGLIYIHCNQTDSLGNPSDSDNQIRADIQVFTKTISPDTGGSGGGGGEPPTNTTQIKEEIQKGLCGNHICENGLDGTENFNENYNSCPADCQGDLTPITDCFNGGDKCLLKKSAAVYWIGGFILLILLITSLLELNKKKGQTTTSFLPTFNVSQPKRKSYYR